MISATQISGKIRGERTYRVEVGCVRRLRHCENSSDKFPINQYKRNTRNIGMKRYKLLYDYFFNWKLTALQCCGILYHTVKLISHQLSSKTQSIKSVKPVTLLILCCPLVLPYSIFPSIRVFTNESVLCIRWPKYWSFSFSISLSNEYSGLICFMMNWLDLLAVQGTLKRFSQHQGSKVLILP